MDTKKFVNLNGNYKTFLGQVDDILKGVELKADTPMTTLQKAHDEIAKLLGGGVVERNDLNNLLINCTNDNVTLKKLRDFAYLRNLRIVEKTVRHAKYKEFVEKMKGLKGGVPSKSIDKAFLQLIKPYFDYWDGVWRFIDFTGGKVRGIDVIDPEDVERFNSYLQ